MSESDEQRFQTPDAISAISLADALDEVRKQYLACKKDKLPPMDNRWLFWSALFVRSWIARIHSEPDHPDLRKRKALFLFWWNRGASLKHHSEPSGFVHRKRVIGIHKDAELMESHILWNKRLNEGQLQWIDNSYQALLPPVKRQILATIPQIDRKKADRPSEFAKNVSA